MPAPICETTWINIDAIYENVAAQSFSQSSMPGDNDIEDDVCTSDDNDDHDIDIIMMITSRIN